MSRQTTASKRDEIFISYAHQDENYLAELLLNIKPQVSNGAIKVWADSHLLAGDGWYQEIKAALGRAKIGVFLVSHHLMASDFIQHEELPALLEAANQGQARLFAIPVYEAVITGSPLAEVQWAREPNRPLTKLSKSGRQSAWVELVKQLIEMYQRKEPEPPEPSPWIPLAYRDYLQHQCQNLEPLIEVDRPLVHRLRRVFVAPKCYWWSEPEMLARLRHEQTDPGDTARPEWLKLEGIVGPAANQKGASAEQARRLDELLHLENHRHFLLIGDAGTGKTTFLRSLALSQLDEEEGWLPLLLPLQTFGRWIAAHPMAHADLLLTWAGEFLSDYGLDVMDIRHRCGSGRVLWLLDGLDEIFDETLQARVSEVIGRWLACPLGNRDRLWLSTRTHVMARVRTVKALGASLQRVPLAALDGDQQQQLAALWFGAIFGEGSPDAEAKTRGLMSDIKQHENLGVMPGNPLLFTVLATLYYLGKRLPDNRAELYQKTIRTLLERRFGSNAGGSKTDVDRAESALMGMALTMMEEGKVRTIGFRDLREAVDRHYEATDRRPFADYESGKAFIESLSLRSGLLVGKLGSPDTSFIHFGFQEYLAARALVEREEAFAYLKNWLTDSGWREVCLLLMGCLFEGGARKAARRYLTDLMAWAGDDVVRLALVTAVAAEAPDDGLPERHLDELRQRAQKAIECYQPPAIRRIELALQLGRIGDPRLGLDRDDRWVWIEPGTFTMGSPESENGHERERPCHQVRLTKGFWLARFPITNQEYAPFVREGYRDPEYWCADGKRWLQSQKSAPENWDITDARYPNQPVTGVSWYEANAFANWLTVHWRKSDRLPMNGEPKQQFFLPSEVQWEYACRAGTVTAYSFGDELGSEQANFGGLGRFGRGKEQVDQSVFTGLSPVGCYTRNDWGLADMHGNVLEWCGGYRRINNGNAERDPWATSGHYRVLRGGSWYGYGRSCRSAYCDHDAPITRNYRIGFRLARGQAPQAKQEDHRE